jgi:uncharacterized membrane protein YphA (DoxX/SURF4 family)
MPDTRILEPRRAEKPAPVEARAEPVRWERRPAYQAYRVLHAGFTIAPILAGLDKFLDWMVPWTMYLSRTAENVLPVQGQTFMYGVGVVEIAAGVLVGVLPRVGAFVVAGWLAAITVNLLLPPGFYDIALRDFGLMLGAIALGLLAREYNRPVPRP